MHLKSIIDERERSGTEEHLCVRTSASNVLGLPKIRENLPNIEHVRWLTLAGRAFDIIECFKEWVNLIMMRSEIAFRSRWALLGASGVKFAFC